MAIGLLPRERPVSCRRAFELLRGCTESIKKSYLLAHMTKGSHHHPARLTYKLPQHEYSPGSSTNQEPSKLTENLNAPCYLKPLGQETTGNHPTRQPQATTQPEPRQPQGTSLPPYNSNHHHIRTNPDNKSPQADKHYSDGAA